MPTKIESSMYKVIDLFFKVIKNNFLNKDCSMQKYFTTLDLHCH